MSGIKDKVVVITGASSGIDAVTAEHLANHGARVVLSARRAERTFAEHCAGAHFELGTARLFAMKALAWRGHLRAYPINPLTGVIANLRPDGTPNPLAANWDGGDTLSVRDPDDPGKYAGTDEEWAAAEAALSEALAVRDYPFVRMEGEAVFYGPKIDVKVIDAIGRSWQLSTIQFDFNLPRRFDLHYVDSDSRHRAPYMVHRAIYGSLERFVGILTEHYAGAFPVWLAPVQAMVIPIADRHVDYAVSLQDRLREAGVRAEVDDSNNRMNKKIRAAQLQKIPYMLVVGDREASQDQASLRLRDGRDLGPMAVEAIVEAFAP